MNEELVSIIMPSYNTAKYIAESIKSVQAQTYKNWELLIVDDCSSDDTDDVVQPFLSDERIKYLKNEKNSGAALTRNKALREAKGKWIAFLDSDDLWHPNKLEKQIEFMVKNDFKFSYTDYKIRLNGVWLPYVYYGPDVVTEFKMKNYCYFSTITVMYDRNSIGLIQIEDIKKNNDYAMWLKIIKKSPCYRLPLCLAYYVKHEGSISSGSKLKLVKHHFIMWRKAEHKSVFSACVLTLRNMIFGVVKKIKYKKNILQEER